MSTRASIWYTDDIHLFYELIPEEPEDGDRDQVQLTLPMKFVEGISKYGVHVALPNGVINAIHENGVRKPKSPEAYLLRIQELEFQNAQMHSLLQEAIDSIENKDKANALAANYNERFAPKDE